MVYGGTGIAVLVLTFTLVYLFTPLGILATKYEGVQLSPWNTQRSVENAKFIVIGKVINIENKVIDESFMDRSFTSGEPLYIEMHQEYYFVTIQTERFLKDITGKHPTEITFMDNNVKGIFFIKGIKTYVESEDAGEYHLGERAIFFLFPFHDEKDLSTNSILGKFVIDDTDGTVQSAYLASKGEPPKKLEDFEAEIKEALAAPT